MEKVFIYGEWQRDEELTEAVSRLVSSGDAEIAGALMQDGDAVRIPDGIDASKICNLLICPDLEEDEAVRQLISAGVSREAVIPGRVAKIPDFSFSRYRRLTSSKISILSNNCWGGLTYHYFGLPFLSPTVNLFIEEAQYLVFLEDLEQMLTLDPKFLYTEYNREEGFEYPVLSIGSVRLHMNHCRNAEEGIAEWRKRRGRLNRENMLVMMSTQSADEAGRFDALPFRNKICFVPFPADGLSSCFTVHPGSVRFADYIISTASGVRRLYDPWILLEEGKAVEVQTQGEATPEARAERTGRLFAGADKILIYGAANLGNRAYGLLNADLRSRFCGFCISKPEGNPEKLFGYPVKTPQDWAAALSGNKTDPGRTLVITALHPRYYDEVRKTLEDCGFGSTVILEDLEYYRFSGE